VSELWVPGAHGPHDEFVTRLHRQIRRFAQKHELETAAVEVELRDGSRFSLDSISPEPGYGFVTLCPHPEEDEAPSELIVPIAMLERIELYAERDVVGRFGFSLPEAAQEPAERRAE
jgi:hypothetical protein